MSSISALVGGEYQTHYTPTKAGVLSLMQSCAIALGKHGIRCNALLPGTILTDINKDDLPDTEKRTYMEPRIPLGPLGAPDDLVGPTVFHASDLQRSEERRVGKEGVSTCHYRWAPASLT